MQDRYAHEHATRPNLNTKLNTAQHLTGGQEESGAQEEGSGEAQSGEEGKGRAQKGEGRAQEGQGRHQEVDATPRASM